MMWKWLNAQMLLLVEIRIHCYDNAVIIDQSPNLSHPLAST